MEKYINFILRFLLGLSIVYLAFFAFGINLFDGKNLTILNTIVVLFTVCCYAFSPYMTRWIKILKIIKHGLSSNLDRVLRYIIIGILILFTIKIIFESTQESINFSEIMFFTVFPTIIAILFLFSLTAYFILKNHVDVLEKVNKNSGILTELQAKYYDFKKDYKQLTYRISWSNKIYKNDNIDPLWLILKNQYIKTEIENIDRQNVELVTDISYYPKIVNSLLQYYLLDNKNEDTKVILVSTMLPEFFFNFPSQISGEDELCFYRQTFVDDYRDYLESLIVKFKEKYLDPNKMLDIIESKKAKKINDIEESFQRYTLVHDAKKYKVDKKEIFSLNDIKRSLNLCMAEHAVVEPYKIDSANNYIHIGSLADKEKKAYEITCNNEEGKNIYDYYSEKLHVSKETSYIKVLDDDDLKNIGSNYDFMLIKDKGKTICIKAVVSLSNNSVSIQPIEGKEVQVISDIFHGIIEIDKNKTSIKDFFSANNH